MAEPDSGQPMVIDACARDAGRCSETERVACELERLSSAAATCGSSDDCTLFQFPPNCLDYGRCPGVPVSYSGEAAFSRDASKLISASCGLPCPLPTTCKQRVFADCVMGRCVFATIDAGVIDAGVRDGGR